MLEIKGKVNTAICYASVIEEEAIEQIRRMCDYEFTAGSKVRIMPDVHAGKGCTIGTTMTVIDKAVPNVVGVDIGCGMYTVNLGNIEIDFEKLDEACVLLHRSHRHCDYLRCGPVELQLEVILIRMRERVTPALFFALKMACDSWKNMVYFPGRNRGKIKKSREMPCITDTSWITGIRISATST